MSKPKDWNKITQDRTDIPDQLEKDLLKLVINVSVTRSAYYNGKAASTLQRLERTIGALAIPDYIAGLKKEWDDARALWREKATEAFICPSLPNFITAKDRYVLRLADLPQYGQNVNKLSKSEIGVKARPHRSERVGEMGAFDLVLIDLATELKDSRISNRELLRGTKYYSVEKDEECIRVFGPYQSIPPKELRRRSQAKCVSTTPLGAIPTYFDWRDVEHSTHLIKSEDAS